MCVEICRSLFCIIGNFNEFPIIQKSLRAGSHCGGKVDVAYSGPPQAENPAKQDSFLCRLRILQAGFFM